MFSRLREDRGGAFPRYYVVSGVNFKTWDLCMCNPQVGCL